MCENHRYSFDAESVCELVDSLEANRLMIIREHTVAASCLLVNINGWCEVDDVQVDPSFRRQGLCKLLIEKATLWARQRHCKMMVLHTQLDNAGMIACAEHSGFVSKVVEHHMEKELQ